MRRHCNKADGLVFTFNAIHPKWSFVKTNESGEVIKVEEKNPISDIATCGIYWYRKGSDFVRYAHRMIEKNIRTNNEFYIAPVYNEMLLDNKTIFPFFVEKMWGLGTPEDLDSFLRNFIG
jgi:dTDP-glucose pyrophosphorylase